MPVEADYENARPSTPGEKVVYHNHMHLNGLEESSGTLRDLISPVLGKPNSSFTWQTLNFMKSSVRCVREFWAWAHLKRAIVPSVKQLTESIAAVHAACSSNATQKEKETDAPIFLLATGWRTGSTLLQRILVTDPRLILWGEPHGDMALLSRAAEMLSCLSRSYPSGEYYIKDTVSSSSMPTSWIANLYPPDDDLRLAFRSLLHQWLGEPARQRGFARWGFKEVRLGAAEATLLLWLYPHAKFVFLSRHPCDCYRSFWRGGDVYSRRPDVRIDSAGAFARHWNRLVTSWDELPVGFPCYRIKYEDLVNGEVDFRSLESWLGIKIRESVALSVSLGSSTKRRRLSWYERFIITREAAPGMRALGYSQRPDDETPSTDR
jgi:hypothetical protein